MYNEQLCYLCSQILLVGSDQGDEMGVSCTVQKTNAYRLLVRTPEVKTLIGELRHRWKDNSKTHLK